MSKILFAMGSAAWTTKVFTSPPARTLKGHARRTQHHRYFSKRLNTTIGVQGRNEFCSALAIEYLVCIGLLAKVKPQPFTTNKEEFGCEICPDFLVEGTGQTKGLFVIETKSARFLNRIKNLELDEYRLKFSQYGMKYLVWTDDRPLNHSVRHNLQQMRASNNREVTTAEIERLKNWVGEQNTATLSKFFENDFDLDCLYAAAWQGIIFFPITKPLLQETVLTVSPQEDYKAIFLDCLNSVDDWWNQLRSTN